MECPHTQSERDAYLDGELTAAESAAFESHLKGCLVCQTVCADSQQVRSGFANGLPYHRVPIDLMQRIKVSLRDASSGAEPRPAVGFLSWQKWSAALLAAAAVLVISVFALGRRSSADDLLAQEIVSDHIRSMMANHLLDVPSLDRHTVKPWFDGKLNFAPPVKDTTPQGFPLIGGRLDYISERAVAALVYKREQHIINLYVWTSAKPADDSQRVLARQGYNLVHWSQSGMTFWAVSDLELTQLQQFATAQQAD